MIKSDYYKEQYSAPYFELEDYTPFGKQSNISTKQSNQMVKENLDYLPEHEE